MRPELIHGIVAGAAMSAWMLLEYALGLHSRHYEAAQYTGWMTELILVVALYLMLRRILSRNNRYWLPVWEGVLHGTYTGFVAAVVFYGFLVAYVFHIHPDWTDNFLEWQVAEMRAAGATEDAVRDLARRFRWTFSPTGLVVTTLTLYTLGGALVSAVLTLWINWRHKDPVKVG